MSLLLLPMLLLAQVDNTAIQCGSSATYYPYGHRWINDADTTAGPPIEPYAWPFQMVTAGSADITGSTAEKDAVIRASLGWVNYDCGNQEFPSIILLPDDDLASGDIDNDGSNVIQWIESQTTWDSEFQGSTTTIAMTTTSSIQQNGIITDADMTFNGAKYKFRAHPESSSTFAGCSTAGADSAICFDVEKVALHEFGHFIGFSHVQCPDAVMYPNGTPTGGFLQLTVHETTGLCELYPPRDPDNTGADFGEFCEADDDCTGSQICVIAPNGTVGWCSITCTSDSSCNTIGEGPTHAYKCREFQKDSTTVKFCGPGLRGTDGGTPAPVDPETGDALDLCAPCSDGNQCATGVCVASEEGETGICTRVCGGQDSDVGENGCPSDMTCVDTSQGSGVCWPSGSTCGGGGDPGGDLVPLNDTCYLRQGQNEQFAPCAAGLVCAIFKAQEGDTQEGACVAYCNTGQNCPDQYQTCCFGIDDAGHCVETATTSPHGGCFEIQNEGEPCVMPEQSLCKSDMLCAFFDYEDETLSKCYQVCSGSECTEDQTCFNNDGQWSFGLCCDTEALESDTECHPGANDKLDLGHECHQDEDCDSNECLRYDGEAACTRSCNPVTQSGCPGDDADIDGDGHPDGGFTCITESGEGKCWPKDGPITGEDPDPPAAPVGSCLCGPGPGTPADWAFAAGLWAVVVWRLRRRA